MAERDWRVAENLPGRLVELREALGDSIPEFTRRFCRTRKQWYQWKEGTQLPGPTLLETAAENYEWPLEIFTEGGRRPKELVNSPVNRIDPTEPIGGPQPHGSPLKTASDLDRAIVELDRVRGTLTALRAALGVAATPAALAKDAEVSAEDAEADDEVRDALGEPEDPSGEAGEEPPRAG